MRVSSLVVESAPAKRTGGRRDTARSGRTVTQRACNVTVLTMAAAVPGADAVNDER
jgi:hypothetical protein